MDGKEYLAHYGILGMKWGHKKGSIHTNPSEDHQVKVRLKNKKVSEMSNAELKALTQRLQLEKQYKDLTKTDISPGLKFVTDLLLNTGKQAAQSYLQKYATKGIDQLMKEVNGGKLNSTIKSTIKPKHTIGFRV